MQVRKCGNALEKGCTLSYHTRRFFIDVGNGFVTLVPTVLFSLCMTWDLIPARIMGVIGVLQFYQMLYGEGGEQ